MPIILLAFACGIISVGFLPLLPHPAWLLLLLPMLVVRFFKTWRVISILLALSLGAGWGIGYGYLLLHRSLPGHLVGEDILVSGRVVDLPVADERRQRFTLKVESVSYLTHPQPADSLLAKFPAKLQLSWYAAQSPAIASGESWQLVVRLKKPRGFVNPGGFDYQAWLIRQGIGGVGYVRSHSLNKKLAEPVSWDISGWRFQLKNWLVATTASEYRGVMLALLIGDRSMIEAGQWRAMQLTGISHLISISGLHVGFLALLGFFIGIHLGRCVNSVWHSCPALLIGYAGAMICAFLYSALAGFNIPTQRTLIMVLAIQLAFFLRRSYSPGHVFLLALLVVVLRDPLAAYDIGFWLSFGAVAVLLVCFAGRYGSASPGVWPRVRAIGRELLHSQWAIAIGLFLPLAVLVSSASLLAPVANILAIPLVTFAVVPLLLLAALIHWWLPGPSQLLLVMAHQALEFLDHWLEFLLALGKGNLNPVVSFQAGSLALAATSVMILLIPRGIIPRYLGYCGLGIALLSPAPQAPDLAITVLDVGQGLAVVVQTPNHQLVYDTGPAYSEKFAAGSAIVAPFLRRQGIAELDALVVSHMDQDHAGGLRGLVQDIPVRKLLAGEPDKIFLDQQDSTVTIADCHQQPPWQWDQVSFRFLHTPVSSRTHSNNRSCVLLLEYAGQTILLPGDIDRQLETYLRGSGQLPAQVTLLLAPHHGSRSSSSPGFVTHTRPQFVVYSAGYRSQHGHPHAEVVARYAASDSRAFTTAESGAIAFVWKAGILQPAIEYRRAQRRYWFD